MTLSTTTRNTAWRVGFLLAALALTLVTIPKASAVPRAPSGFFGVVPQTDISTTDTARMKRGNIKQIRVPIFWRNVETSPGEFDWSATDSIFRDTAKHRVRVMPTLYGTPEWITPSWTKLPVGNANQLKRWRKFVRAVALRYGFRGRFWDLQRASGLPVVPVREWQLWNEPNFHHFSTPVSPARYARLVRAGSSAIRAVNRNGRIVIGGLFGRPKGPPARARHASTFLRQMRRKINRKAFDALAIHPYAPNARDLRWIMRNFRTVAKRNGLGSKSIYITEIGWASGRKTNAFMAGSKRAQAKRLRSAFTYLIRDRRRLRLRQVYWFAWKDLSPAHTGCNFCGTIGLFSWSENQLKAKPAWRTFVKFTRGRP